MPAKSANGRDGKPPPSAATNLIGEPQLHFRPIATIASNSPIAGGAAGMMEALVCHPLGMFISADSNEPGY
jgi:hypothetical protein